MQSAEEVETETANEAIATATETETTTTLLTKQQEQKKEAINKKPGFFVLRKKGLYNSWNPVALYDSKTGYFKGVAYFSGLWECVQYKKKCEDKAIKNFLKERKGIYGNNNTIGKHRSMMNEDTFKIFIEHEIPSIKPQFLR